MIETINPLTDLLGDDGPKQQWVVMSHDKKLVLYDPTTQLPFVADTEMAAQILAKDVTQDFGIPASPCELHRAIVEYAYHKYGLTVKYSNNPKELMKNVANAVLKEGPKATGLN